MAGSQFKIFPHFTFLFVVPVHLLCLQVLMVLKTPQMTFMLYHATPQYSGIAIYRF